MKDFTCYGGPMHGKPVKMFDGSDYLVPHRRNLSIADAWHESTDRVERPSFDVIVYRIQTWSYGSVCPNRLKQYRFLLADGYTLTNRDKYELDDQLLNQPWVFPQVSILEQFDEWFAQSVYRHTRQLYWKGKRVWD